MCAALAALLTPSPLPPPPNQHAARLPSRTPLLLAAAPHNPGNDKIGARESRKFGFQAALNVGIFGGSMRFGTTNRISLNVNAYVANFEVLAAAASFVYGGSVKFDLSKLTSAGAAVVNSASTCAGEGTGKRRRRGCWEGWHPPCWLHCR